MRSYPTHCQVGLSTTLMYARTFHVNGAPALMAITTGEESEGPAVEVYSLPSLGLIMQVLCGTDDDLGMAGGTRQIITHVLYVHSFTVQLIQSMS